MGHTALLASSVDTVRATQISDARMAVISTEMIRGSGGSGNKEMHSDYLQVGHRWIR